VAKVKDSFTDCFGCFRMFCRALRTATGFSDILRVATSFWILFGSLDASGVLFGCFAEQDRLADVRTDCRAPAEDPGESSRSQGTTTKSGRDVYGGVKWAALEIT
jgi:hypothetical protein